ncbi:hypothetical protein C9426_10055 [Serratia sp. S1B]|nr:hypothetical protein C9426_10055 [Serratia sp. S1B]
MGKLKKTSDCLSCGQQVSVSASKCPFCDRPNPTQSINQLLIINSIFILISLGLAFLYSHWFFILTILIILASISVMRGILKCKGENKGENKPIKTRTVEKKQAAYSGLMDFHDNLSIVWSGEPYEIEFSYKDGNGDRTRRKITLSEISVAADFTPYLLGYCHLRNEDRHFKMSRIVSKIKYKSKLYDVIEFIDVVMDLDFDLVKKIDEHLSEDAL